MDIIERAARAVAAAGPRARGRRFGESTGQLVGRAALALREQGASWEAVAMRLDLSVPSAQRWLKRAAERDSTIPALLPVRVSPAVQAITQPGITIIHRSGWRAEGLTAAELAALISAL